MEHKEVGGDWYRFDIRDFNYLCRQCNEPLPVYLVEFIHDRHYPVYVLPAWAVEDKPEKTIRVDSWTTRLRPGRLYGNLMHFEKTNTTVYITDFETYEKILERVVADGEK